MPAVCRIGDADSGHCSGMVRAQGSPNVFANGRPVSCQNDKNTVHKTPTSTPCPSHAAPITTGSGTVKVNGDGIGRVGHGISACTTVAAGSKNVFADTH